MKRRYSLCLFAAVVLLFAAGCGKKKTPESPAPADEPAASPTSERSFSPATEIPLDEAPPEISAVLGKTVPMAGTITIPDLRKTAKPGDVVSIDVKVMGTDDPFNSENAVFIVGDELTVASCDLLGIDEQCPTPWDVHYEEPGAVKAGTAVIRIVDAEGSVYPSGLRGMGGLKELSRLRIEGRIFAMEPDALPIIDATAIEIVR